MFRHVLCVKCAVSTHHTQLTHTDTQTHTHTSGIVIICALSPRSASVVALRCLLHGGIRNAPHFPSSRFQFVRIWVFLLSDRHFATCAHLGSNLEGVSSSFCAPCLERLRCVAWCPGTSRQPPRIRMKVFCSRELRFEGRVVHPASWKGPSTLALHPTADLARVTTNECAVDAHPW